MFNMTDLEILQKRPTHRPASQRVLVSIKPRAPAIKTLYVAEKSRFHSKKVLDEHLVWNASFEIIFIIFTRLLFQGSDRSGSRLGIGDHSSFTTRKCNCKLFALFNLIVCVTFRPGFRYCRFQ